MHRCATRYSSRAHYVCYCAHARVTTMYDYTTNTTNTYIHTHIHTCVHTLHYTHVCVCACVLVCVCTHTHTCYWDPRYVCGCTSLIDSSYATRRIPNTECYSVFGEHSWYSWFAMNEYRIPNNSPGVRRFFACPDSRITNTFEILKCRYSLQRIANNE